MTKSVIECPWTVGDKLYCTAAATFSFVTFEGAMHQALKKLDKGSDIFPLIQLRVTSVRMYMLVDGEDGALDAVPVESATENIYKVMRNRSKAMAITIVTRDMDEVVRLEWPKSQPFHDAFGPMEEGSFRQVMHVSALNVDGNYKLIEVLDDQDW